jgi:hypothetical protein
MPPHESNELHHRRSSRSKWIGLGVLGAAVITFILFAHPFLAVTKRVDADLLVVEGWIPGYMLGPAAEEFHRGKYTHFLVSGLENDPADRHASDPDALRTTARLEALGVPRNALVACPAPFARWMRTSKTAHAVRDKVVERGLKPTGVNVITAGPHARETWVAYEHAFGDSMPVGIISIPKNNYPADRWWTSRQGLVWVPKDFIAWLKEVLIGRRA